ncbi:MAG: 3-dehydroquinate synthase [Flavobacteriaceae bacterium]|nr:3-dehydroquinate synthase [Flavobacteriaceae bacterium]
MSPVYYNEEAFSALTKWIADQQYSKVFILVDTNTEAHCLPVIQTKLSKPDEFEVLVIPAGETHKNIQVSEQLWQQLSDRGADRKSLLINLGGGVVTDIGGFVAATFRRGIHFINIPTSLLAMVDAAIGGKTGVDLGVLKNQVGVILQPQMVLVITKFLKTLATRQVANGKAEMYKHGLIFDAHYWSELTGDNGDIDTHIRRSVEIKNEIVAQDLTENGLRKVLNFGHTLGHAIESHFLERKDIPLYHGEAIIAGMILEGYLSNRLTGLAQHQLIEITDAFNQGYAKIDFTPTDIKAICDLLKFDKKNTHGHVNFVLLTQIGAATFDVKVPDDMIQKAFAYYKEA